LRSRVTTAGLGAGRQAHTFGLGRREGIEAGVFGVVGGEGAGEHVAPLRGEIVGNAELGGGGDVGGVHGDVPCARLLAVGHRGDLENFVREPHRDVVERHREAAGEAADGGVAVVDELEDAVDRGVGVGEVDLGEDGGEAVVAARIPRQDGGEEFGRDFGQVGGGRRRNEGKAGDSHAGSGAHGRKATPEAQAGKRKSRPVGTGTPTRQTARRSIASPATARAGRGRSRGRAKRGEGPRATPVNRPTGVRSGRAGPVEASSGDVAAVEEGGLDPAEVVIDRDHHADAATRAAGRARP
jgi:hypothetical protein